MLLCDDIMFWIRHRRQPIYHGNLAAYCEYKNANPTQKPFVLGRFKPRWKSKRRQ